MAMLTTSPWVGAGAGAAGADGVLDDLAEAVLRQNGAVLAVPPDLVPSPAGLAAIYRY
jgi:hypothetical protein